MEDYIDEMEYLEQVDNTEFYEYQIEELQQRIDKAIEYIENEFYEVGGCVGGSDLPYQPIQNLLDILRGEE